MVKSWCGLIACGIIVFGILAFEIVLSLPEEFSARSFCEKNGLTSIHREGRFCIREGLEEVFEAREIFCKPTIFPGYDCRFVKYNGSAENV